MKRAGCTVTGICAVLTALAFAPPARADAGPPTGRVDGWHSPVEQTLALTVHADAADGTTLGHATVALDGTPLVTAALCPSGQACTETDAGGVTLSFDSVPFPDGVHQLTVTVTDADGGAATVLSAPTEIWNDRPAGSATATLTVGSVVPVPPLPAVDPGGGVLGAAASGCLRPKLSMRLSQRPLRIEHGVPVLVKGKRYRFTGRLTCLVKGKRVSARKHTHIQLRALLRGRSYHKGRATVGSRGRIAVRFSVPSSRTLEFRFPIAGRTVTRVRIKVRVVKVAEHRHEKG
jgi:hypothetical protein